MDLVEDQSRQATAQSEGIRWGLWFVILNLVDGFQTSSFVNQRGVAAELNPWIRYIMSEHSTLGMWAVKLMIITLVLVIFRKNLGVMRAASIGIAIIVAMNFWTIGFIH